MLASRVATLTTTVKDETENATNFEASNRPGTLRALLFNRDSSAGAGYLFTNLQMLQLAELTSAIHFKFDVARYAMNTDKGPGTRG